MARIHFTWSSAALALAIGVLGFSTNACGSDDDGQAGGKGAVAGTGAKGGTGGSGGAGGSGASGGSGGAAGSSGAGGSGGGPQPSAGCITGITADPDIQQALPQTTIDTTYVAPTGKKIPVASGGDLQAAIDGAEPGDVIELAAGATFQGPVTLPAKSGNDWIVIRTSTADADLPAPGTRIDPSYAPKLARIEVAANVGSAIEAEAGAHHYRLIGLEIAPTPGSFVYVLVDLGGNAKSDAEFPHDIIIDRSYLHGDPTAGTRRAVALNGKTQAVIDSWIADCKEVGADSQAIAGWLGPGPYKIVNNHLEGAGENVIFGGGDPAVADVVPSDIEVCANHVFKPTAWKDQSWSVKNSFELKNARRVYVVGNVFENNWADAQVGFAIVLTPRNQDGTAPWSTIEDVTFALNVVRHSGSGVNILGEDDNHPSQQQQRVLIQNNLFEDIDESKWGGQARIFQVITPSKPTVGLKIDHNTVNHTGNSFLTMGDTTVVAQNFFFTNNVVPKGDYGAFGGGQGEGNKGLDFYVPGAVFKKNVIIGGSQSIYPADNFFPADAGAVGFVDFAAGGQSLALAASSTYKTAGTDGKDIGADFTALGPVFAVATP